MMGIYIKGMEMPKSCADCPIGDSLHCLLMPGVPALWKEYTLAIRTNRRHKDCPLVPLPPHGRLVDADALASEMEKQIKKQDELMELCKSAGDTKNYFNTSKVQIGMVSFLRALNNAPTIIPVDKEEEEA